ncbi:MAG: tRNA epoxyqueuosine(34) reductase QueG [Actinomycetota bacterium]
MLKQRLRKIAMTAGCSGFGVTTAEPFEDVRVSMNRRRANDLAADLAFTYRDTAVATDIRRTFPWADRIVAVAYAYEPEAGMAVEESGRMRIARFADGDRYEGLRNALDAVATQIQETGHRAEVLVDDSRLVDRAVAVRAGVGWWGRSTMVLAPGVGPWMLLGSVATDAPLEADQPMSRTCGTCVECIPACPTGAILPDGALDANLCLAYWLQTTGVIPPELRSHVGDRLYGCDDCLTSCPPGMRAHESARLVTGPAISDVLGAADADLLARYGHFYLPARRPRILKRNALVAAGNDRSPHLERFVVPYIGHPDWLLRAHAVWAAGEFDTAVTRAALDAALADEPDRRVRGEIHLAKAHRADEGGLR